MQKFYDQIKSKETRKNRYINVLAALTQLKLSEFGAYNGAPAWEDWSTG